ncbi:MAG: hypothetical protein E6K69_08800 [Nitrospirae bacterium]|nr:MAG: hypothetical protein E6K69_08800 [Nitrospirota bacterium]
MHEESVRRHLIVSAAADQEGIALLTVMLLLLIMTVIGIAAITVTSLENRMAGYLRTGEAAASAAESCVGTGVNIIQQTIVQGSLPAAFLDNAVPAGPVPNANSPTLNQEIMGQSDNNGDVPTVAPNTGPWGHRPTVCQRKVRCRATNVCRLRGNRCRCGRRRR